MGKKKDGTNKSKEAAELRQRAEARLAEQKSSPNDYVADLDKVRLIHELKVHQVELEMQNEELLRSRLEVEAGLERYTDLYDFAPVGYFTLSRDGSIRQVNLSGATLLGVERSRLVGMRFGVFVSEADRSVFNGFLGRVFSGRAKELCEGVFLKEDNQLFVRLEGVVFKEGEECRVAVMDLTERKGAEEALQKAHAELEHRVQERTAELKQAVLELQRSNQDLEQFAYVSSHDLQEPLRMVSAYCGLLEKNYADKLDEDAREYIGYAVEGAKRMQQLIKNLLDYSRVNTRRKPFGPVNCGEVFKHVLNNLSMVISETKAQVTCDSLPTVWGDESQIMQVFQNLIENALKFRKGQEPPVIHVSAGLNGREWVFSVRDKGIGIDSQYHSRIFVIFQRLHTRSLYPGTGIGLTIVKRIVERHGGQICIESVPGEGSNFIFTLPDAGGYVS